MLELEGRIGGQEMKKFFLGFLLVFTSISTMSLSASRYDIGIGMGGFSPDNDALVQQTFGKNFFWQGYMGLYDENGWEVRGALGGYGDTSHNPLDLGNNVRISMFPILTASLIYNFATYTSFVQPYLGGGVNCYFYNVADDIFGTLEAGTRFGFHGLCGLKINIMPDMYLMAEYNRNFIPPVFFNGSKNFDSSALAIGVGFSFPVVEGRHAKSAPQYRYTKEEEELLVQIQQAKTEIKDMKKKRADIEEQIDEFYQTNDDADNSPELAKNMRRINYLERKLKDLDRQITDAQDDLKELQQDWKKFQVDSRPVEDHIVYLQQNYRYSPYGLRLNGGYFNYYDTPYVYHYYHERNYNPPQYNNNQTQSQSVEDKKAFAEKKKKRLEELKNRTLQ